MSDSKIDTYTPLLWVFMSEDERYAEYIRVRRRNETVRWLVERWRAMIESAYHEGPIPGDETGHAARWTAVETCADEVEAALSLTSDTPLTAPAVREDNQ